MHPNMKVEALMIILLLTSIHFTGENLNTEGQVQSSLIIVDINGNGDYSSISDALFFAQNGDEIIVYDGIYNETITIGKNINIIGNGSNTIIENDSNTLIQINSNNVILDNLSIRNSISNNMDSSIININRCENVSLNNLTVNSRNNGINLINSRDVKILQSSITSMKKNIFSDIYSLKVLIENNSFDGYYSTHTIIEYLGRELILKNNSFNNSSIVVRDDIYNPETYIIENNYQNNIPIRFLKKSNNITISSNTSQIIIYNCQDITITNLSFTECFNEITVINSKRISIKNNIFTNIINDAIILKYSTDTEISKNNFTNCYNGINANSDNILIYNNILINTTIGMDINGNGFNISNNSFLRILDLPIIIEGNDHHLKGCIPQI